MGKLIEMHQRLAAVTADVVERRALDIIKAEQDQLTDLNKQQLQQSIDSEGDPLGDYASIAYANLKGRSDVDLKLTGKFYDSFFIKSEKFPVVFSATDSKTESLVEKYGDVFGLTEQNKKVVSRDILKVGLVAWLRNLIHV